MFLLEFTFLTSVVKTTDTHTDTTTTVRLHNQIPLLIKGNPKLCNRFFHMLQTGKDLQIKQDEQVISQEMFQAASCVLTPTIILNTNLKVMDILTTLHLSDCVTTYFKSLDHSMRIYKLSQEDQLILQVALLLENPCHLLIIEGNWTKLHEHCISCIKDLLKHHCKQGCYIILHEGSSCLFDEYETWDIEAKPPTSPMGFLEESIPLVNCHIQPAKKHSITQYGSRIFISLYLLISMCLVVFISSYPHLYDEVIEEYDGQLHQYEAATQKFLYVSASHQKILEDYGFVPDYPFTSDLKEKLHTICKDVASTPIHKGHFIIGNDPEEIAVIKDGKRIALYAPQYDTNEGTTSFSSFTTFQKDTAAYTLMIDDVQDGVYLSSTMASFVKENLDNASIEVELGVPVKWIKTPINQSAIAQDYDYRFYHQSIRVTLPIAGVVKQSPVFYGDIYIPDTIYQTIYEDALALYDQTGPTEASSYHYDSFGYVGEDEMIEPYTPSVYVISVSDQAQLETIKSSIQAADELKVAVLDPYTYIKQTISYVDETKEDAITRFLPFVYIGITIAVVMLLIGMVLRHTLGKQLFFQTNKTMKRSIIQYVIYEACGGILIVWILSTSWVGDLFNHFVNTIMYEHNALTKWMGELWYINTWIQSDLWRVETIIGIVIGCFVVAMLPVCSFYLIQNVRNHLIRKENHDVPMSKM